MTTEFVTVKDVRLAKAGTWKASTGEKSITKEDLASCVEAEDSALLSKAVLKKGHTDPRHNNPAWDGEPAYGQATNLRLADDGESLVGDFVNVPKELAESLDSAYPERSAEIAWNVKMKNAAGEITKTFKAALAGVALLGATPPAIKGLNAPVTAFSGTECDSVDSFDLSAFAFDGGHTGNSLRSAIESSIDATYRRSGTNVDPGVYPWMVDHDDANAWFRTDDHTYQVGYTVAADGVVSLSGEAVRVVEKKTYTVISDTPTVPHTMLSEKHDGVVTSADNAPTNEEESPMSDKNAFLEKLRVDHGLPDTATEEEIYTAAKPAAKVAEPAAVEPAANEAEKGRRAAGVADDGTTVAVSAEGFTALSAEVVELRAKTAELEVKSKNAHVAGLVSGFTKAGKLFPGEMEYFSAKLADDEEGTVKFLTARTGIPVAEIGTESTDAAHFGEAPDYNGAYERMGL